MSVSIPTGSSKGRAEERGAELRAAASGADTCPWNPCLHSWESALLLEVPSPPTPKCPGAQTGEQEGTPQDLGTRQEKGSGVRRQRQQGIMEEQGESHRPRWVLDSNMFYAAQELCAAGYGDPPSLGYFAAPMRRASPRIDADASAGQCV